MLKAWGSQPFKYGNLAINPAYLDDPTRVKTILTGQKI
ncbi:MAG: hypothetical protein CM15mP103_04350 [Gammaproteobacteria bacterium]|nr:MAG: hypothetical protein CM15mP103_04350 [Gammaproteobacteria bacterium]